MSTLDSRRKATETSSATSARCPRGLDLDVHVIPLWAGGNDGRLRKLHFPRTHHTRKQSAQVFTPRRRDDHDERRQSKLLTSSPLMFSHLFSVSLGLCSLFAVADTGDSGLSPSPARGSASRGRNHDSDRTKRQANPAAVGGQTFSSPLYTPGIPRQYQVGRGSIFATTIFKFERPYDSGANVAPRSQVTGHSWDPPRETAVLTGKARL